MHDEGGLNMAAASAGVVNSATGEVVARIMVASDALEVLAGG